jgi:hypothetical protein
MQSVNIAANISHLNKKIALENRVFSAIFREHAQPT